MNAFYLLLGSEGALADRALNKLLAELKEAKAEITSGVYLGRRRIEVLVRSGSEMYLLEHVHELGILR